MHVIPQQFSARVTLGDSSGLQFIVERKQNSKLNPKTWNTAVRPIAKQQGKTAVKKRCMYNILYHCSVLQQYHHTVLPVSGELEISMLRYEFEQTKFVIRVTRGRNLPPGDSPGQTSDPYVIISTIPDWNNEGTQKTSSVNGNKQIHIRACFLWVTRRTVKVN